MQPFAPEACPLGGIIHAGGGSTTSGVMHKIFAVISAIGVWLLWEAVGALVTEVPLRPLLRPVARFLAPLASGPVVVLLWLASAGTLLWWPVAVTSPSPRVRLVSLGAFLTVIPCALWVSFAWTRRGRPRMLGQESLLVRVMSGLLAVFGAFAATLFLWGDGEGAWSIYGPMLLVCFSFGAVTLTGRVPGARLLRPNTGLQRTGRGQVLAKPSDSGESRPAAEPEGR